MRFFVIGDWGTGTAAQQQVADLASANRLAPHAVISTGDNFYEKGVTGTDDPKWKERFTSVYRGANLQVSWYAVLGNHDYYGDPQAQVAFRSDPRWKMPSRYFSRFFRMRGGALMSVMFLDTMQLAPGESRFQAMVAGSPQTLCMVGGGRGYEQLQWLERVLRYPATWKIVVGHYPVYSAGEHGDTRELVDSLVPLFKKYGVTAYFCGHDHSLQHIHSDGIEYFVCGSGGGRLGSIRSDMPQLRYGSKLPGYMEVTAGKDLFQVRTMELGGESYEYTRRRRN